MAKTGRCCAHTLGPTRQRKRSNVRICFIGKEKRCSAQRQCTFETSDLRKGRLALAIGVDFVEPLYLGFELLFGLDPVRVGEQQIDRAAGCALGSSWKPTHSVHLSGTM